ncbi:MAG: hypothetical protein WC979_02155 [Candidatus Pacearchaeota archaeon]|jgi:hypothetical protein|nr:hypothetical protein [Clostridia bacterium]
MKAKTKVEMLNEMFIGTQYAKHINEDSKLPAAKIKFAYDHFTKNFDKDPKTAAFCSALLGSK